MPADITGTNVVQEIDHGERHLEFQPGPIFGNIILADENQPGHTEDSNPLFWKQCRKRRSPSARKHTNWNCRFRSGDAEPSGDGRDLPPSRSPVGSLLHEAERGLPNGREHAHDPESDDQPDRTRAAASTHRQGDSRHARHRVGGPDRAARAGVCGSARSVGRIPTNRRHTTSRNSMSAMAPVHVGLRRWFWVARFRALLNNRIHVSADDIRAIALPVAAATGSCSISRAKPSGLKPIPLLKPSSGISKPRSSTHAVSRDRPDSTNRFNAKAGVSGTGFETVLGAVQGRKAIPKTGFRTRIRRLPGIRRGRRFSLSGLEDLPAVGPLVAAPVRGKKKICRSTSSWIPPSRWHTAIPESSNTPRASPRRSVTSGWPTWTGCEWWPTLTASAANLLPNVERIRSFAVFPVPVRDHNGR